jgi:YD repeat-containing protein
VHLWRPGGFDPNGKSIEPLAGFSCAVELRTVDTNRNGKIELILPGLIKIGGTPSTQTKTYSALERNADGTWKTWDTKLPVPPSPGRAIFGDFNGDGLPDAITNGLSDGRLRTWMNTGNGFAEKPVDRLKWDGLFPQDTYFLLASPLDWDGDGRTDLLLAMSEPPELPKWYILRATGGTNTFERFDAKIPFDAQLGDAVTLADPRGPRIGDVNGDGAADVVLFIGNEVTVFQNQAGPDVLVSFSDGLTEHEPEDPGFVPNVSFSYGHLIDEWKTNGALPNDPKKESYLYLSHADSNNDCAYPRRCAVGSRRIVREYGVKDGQDGVRRFGVRYRDARYDRRGHGFLGFGERIITDLETNAGTATVYDNATVVSVGARDVYAFSGQAKSQWRWAPALPNEPQQNRVELVFADMTSDVVPTNDGQTYFTLSTNRRIRRMQGTFSAATSLESWVASIEANENATMLRDSMVQVLDYDVFGNALRVNVSTIGVDLSYETTRIVKNDTALWILGQVQNRTECSKAGVDEQCRSFTYTTNEFGEVESATSSDDNIPDTKLTVEYDKRDKYGNVEHVTARDEFGHVRTSTTVFDDDGVFPVREINARQHATTLEYDRAFGALKKVIDPNGLVTEWQYDSHGRETHEKRPDRSQTTTT